MSSVNTDKLSKLQAQVLSSSGPRRKTKKVVKTAVVDDKKLQTALKKFNAQNLPGIDEVNMFQDDGNVLHFKQPKVQAVVNANTFAISGHSEEKELTELVPGILTQLGPDSIASLRKIAEAYQAHAASGKGPEDIPELVENLSLNDDEEEADEKDIA